MSEDTEKFAATLVRGETYYLRDVRFEKGKPRVVTAASKEHLEDSAIDELKTNDDDENGESHIIKQKFAFEPYTGQKGAGEALTAEEMAPVVKAAPARRRSRSAE